MTTAKSIERKTNQLFQRLQSITVTRLGLCLAISVVAAGKSAAVTLRAGDIVVVDSSAAVL